MTTVNTTMLTVNLGSLTNGGESGGNYQYHNLDATNDAVAWSIGSIEGELISKVGFLVASVTGSSPTYKIGLEGFTSTGYPDGTYLNDGGGEASTTTTLTAGENVITLDFDYQTTVEEHICLTIRYSSGTIDGSNYAQVSVEGGGFYGYLGLHGAGMKNTAGTWAIMGNASRLFSWRSSTKTYGWPSKGTANLVCPSDANDIVACKFALSADLGSTYRIDRIFVNGGPFFTGNALSAGVFSAAGALLSGLTIADGESYTSTWHRYQILINPDYDFAFGTTYYVGFKKSAAGGNTPRIACVEVTANADLEAYPGGTSTYMATWDDSASTWTEYNTYAPMHLQLRLSQIVTSAGAGGGGARNPIRGPV